MSKDTLKKTEKKNTLNGSDLLVTRSANDWLNYASGLPDPNKLFDEFWCEGELCILFADTGQCKSILGVQIGDRIAAGKPFHPFTHFTNPQKVLLCDFELSAKQFQLRYSDEFGHYKFNDNFHRLEINPDADIPENKTFEQAIFPELETTIESTGTKILIVDNLTYLRTGTETAKDALPLMKLLKGLKRKFNLSILVLAHTPKRDASRPITINDLQGSKMLMNFCDSSFAIGESAENKSIKYIKQIKVRNTKLLYDADNVMLFELTKQDRFTKFVFSNYGYEQHHLARRNNIEDLEMRAKNLKQEGKSIRETADEMGIHYSKVHRLLKSKDESEPLPF